jgi:hypothetical protein
VLLLFQLFIMMNASLSKFERFACSVSHAMLASSLLALRAVISD